MSAAILIRSMREQGIKLSANGDRLHVEAPKGTVTAEIRDLLMTRKPDILAELREPRAEIRLVAEREGESLAAVDGLEAVDVEDCAGRTTDELRAYIRALADTADRDAGKRPTGYDTPAVCDGCGPVWLWPEVCEQSDRRAPNGWPVVMSCPWCFRRRAGQLFDRPDVKCQDCRHFVPNTRNPRGGFGGCAADDSRGFLPFKVHTCPDWQPDSDTTPVNGEPA